MNAGRPRRQGRAMQARTLIDLAVSRSQYAVEP